MAQKFINIPVEEKGQKVEDLHAKLMAAVDIIAVLKALKEFLESIGLWDDVIKFLNDAKAKLPTFLQFALAALIAWLEAL